MDFSSIPSNPYIFNRLLIIFLIPIYQQDTPYSPVMGPATTTSPLLKLKVIIWKNWVIRRHHWFLTLCEILLPILQFALFAYTRSQVGGMGKQYVNTSSYAQLESTDLILAKFPHQAIFLYAPRTNFTAELIHGVQTKLEITNNGTYI